MKFTARHAYEGSSAAKTLGEISFADAIDTTFGSPCVSSSGSGVGILNVNWRASFTSSKSDGYGLLVGTEKNPLSVTMHFAWVPCA
jgi:hypothetical protein